MDSVETAGWPTVLETDRLRLRPAEAADFPAYATLWTDPEVRRFVGGPIDPQEVTRRQNNFRPTPNAFSVVLRDRNVMVGSLSIDSPSRFEGRRELALSFLPEHWGHGYARESVSALIEWALVAVPNDSPTVIAATQLANHRSRRLLQAVGMNEVDRFEKWGAPQIMYSTDPEHPSA